MKKRVEIILTNEQVHTLDKQAHQAGFLHRSEYIRYLLFKKLKIQEEKKE